MRTYPWVEKKDGFGMWKRLILFLAAVTITMSAQVGANKPSFTSNEIAIYRDFLLHYQDQLSNMIGMQGYTVAFVAPTGSRSEPVPPSLEIPAYSGRRLPPEVMALTTDRAVTARIAAAGKLLNLGKRDPQLGPDGFVRTSFTLSEIAFDPQHDLAAFNFRAFCDCIGGQSAMVVYEKKNGRWTFKTMLNHYIG